MKTKLTVLAAAAAFLAIGACTQPSSDLHAVVTDALASVAAVCTEVDGRADTSKAVQKADLNGDGVEDFVLFLDWVNCENAASIYGDREKELTVYVGDRSGGATEAFNDSVYGAAIEGAGSTAQLWLTTSGGMCGRPPAPDFASESFCDRALVWSDATRRFDYAPVSGARPIV